MSDEPQSETPPPKAESTSKSRVLSLNITSKSSLYSTYISFLKNGGFFIPTDENIAMGEEIFLVLTLGGKLNPEPEKHLISGKVAWISPASHSERSKGIGIHFEQDEKSQSARRAISKILGPLINAPRMTHTM